MRARIIEFNQLQKDFNSKLPAILEFDRGITGDAVKHDSYGSQYFDLVMSYLESSRKTIAEGGVLRWKLCTRLLFITTHIGSETSESIHDNLNRNLKLKTGFTLEAFEKLLNS